MVSVEVLFFFFQAEDGIRDGRVTGVQTCALPISEDRDERLVALLWGRDARTLKPLLAPHPSIESAHPSPLSAHNGFFGSRPFSRANALLAEQGAEPIDWRLP